MKRFSDFNVTPPERQFDGEKIKIFKLLNKEIKVPFLTVIEKDRESFKFT